ncbi:TlpA family protein disulfide reductase [Paenibacillus sp. Leaf72]|uniref:TlpA family protein disulfide reductase n=1 Tax=Paenibacillus sp. Leaf72 TaxID=1736234 RepID=UPI0006F3E15C|nr:hypothetical protein [Paenibacillus sp. Leaf72]KQO10862.1 hypothetical protein ASF12_10790 [Paenibacillus sp. Leaf72]
MNSTREIDEDLLGAFLTLKFIDSKGEKSTISRGEGETILFFTSLYCIHCIDLLPHLIEIQKLVEESTIILFSDGSSEELSDMINYFDWPFQVLRYEESNMEDYFPQVMLPFTVILDTNNKVKHVATIYNKNDFMVTQFD